MGGRYLFDSVQTFVPTFSDRVICFYTYFKNWQDVSKNSAGFKRRAIDFFSAPSQGYVVFPPPGAKEVLFAKHNVPACRKQPPRR